MIEARSRQWWRATSALCLGSFLVFINLYVVQPLLPELRHTFGISTLVASLPMSLATLTLAASLLLFGSLSDAMGRGPIMRATLLLTALCSLVMYFAPSFESLVLLRMLQGLMIGGLPSVAVAWMGDEFDNRALMLAVGLYISANSLGGISGRVVGGVVAERVEWHGAFLAVGIFSLIGVALFWWLLPKAQNFTPTPFKARVALGAIRDHLRNPLLLAAYLIGGLNFMVFINQYSYVTFRLSDAPYNLSAQWLGLLFLTYLGGTLGSAISGRIAQRFSQPVCLMLGIAVFMLGSLATLSDSLLVIVAGLTVNAFGFFFAHSTASSWVSRNARQSRGSATALYLVFYYLGASIGIFYLEPFWLVAGWPGVIAGSWLILLFTLGTANWLRRRNARSAT
ncbi:MFS transporter [Pistricoccus aurantiacus]|uniref:MFS transporter n=1 Tax=Pistricoccus aurantiacus TaxID=1883414 RepID=A0A5B8ST06_9GAMM|nr:MFS transporter [Pistricoccus aurantiacus]QEA39421.1 MFS transporter [Pistricoccus aurantiacus]